MSDTVRQLKPGMPAEKEGAVVRDAAAGRLDASLSGGCAVTLVSAPPGYGKTAAVAGWLRRREWPYAWLTLDEPDNDPARFLADAAAAMRAAGAPFSGLMPAEAGPAPFPGAEWAASALLGALPRDGKAILALDDLHVIRSGEIFDILRLVIDRLPEGVHLILLTREDPSLPIARWRAGGRMAEIREGALRFTLSEAKQFLTGMGVDLPDAAAEALHRRTEGWAAGLYLAGLALLEMDAPQRLLFIAAFQGTQRYIVDYLVEEALAGADEPLRLFLRRTAVAGRFNAALCEALTGRQDSAALLVQLEKRNLFLFPLDENRQWYRYHSLFGDILTSGLPAGERAALRRTAAGWLEENGYVEEALRLAAEAGDHPRAARLLTRAAPRLIRDGEVKTLLSRLDELPKEILASDATLVIARAWCLMMAGRAREAAAAAGSLTPELLREASPDTVEMLDVLLLFLQISCDAGAVSGLKQAAAARAGGSREPRAYALHATAQRLLIEGRVGEAAQEFIGAWRRGLADGGHHIALLSAKDAAMNLLVLGRKRECDRFCRQVMGRYAPEGRPATPLAAMMRLPMAASSLAGNDLEEALGHIREALPLYRRMSMVYLVLQAEIELSVILRAMGRVPEAFETLADAADSLEELNFRQAAGFVKAIEADFLLACGKTEQAARWAQGAAAEAEGAITHMNERQAVVCARILASSGQEGRARPMLGRLEAVMAAGFRNYRLVSVYLLQSILYHRENRPQMAAERMERALGLATGEGLFRLFLDEGPDVLAILRGMPPSWPEFTERLFAMARVSAGGQPHGPGGRAPGPAAPEALPEGLSDREKEVLLLAADGCSNQDIARALYITLGTVKWHMNNIFSKMGTSRRTQAIAQARKLNII